MFLQLQAGKDHHRQKRVHLSSPRQRMLRHEKAYTPIPRGGGPSGTACPTQSAGLRTRGPPVASTGPSGRRFPGKCPVHDDGGRSHSPLRDSPGFSPGSLSHPETPAGIRGASTPGAVFGAPHDRAGRTSCTGQHRTPPARVGHPAGPASGRHRCSPSRPLRAFAPQERGHPRPEIVAPVRGADQVRGLRQYRGPDSAQHLTGRAHRQGRGGE